MSKAGKKNSQKGNIPSSVARTYGRFVSKDFLKLARNSYAVKKFSRAIDNCRLAVDMAIKNKNNHAAAEAYDLWINILLEEGKYAEVKKTACEARSRIGNYLDLLYYEFVASLHLGNPGNSAKLGREFIQLAEAACDGDSFGARHKNKVDEVKSLIGNSNDDPTKFPSDEAEHEIPKIP